MTNDSSDQISTLYTSPELIAVWLRGGKGCSFLTWCMYVVQDSMGFSQMRCPMSQSQHCQQDCNSAACLAKLKIYGQALSGSLYVLQEVHYCAGVDTVQRSKGLDTCRGTSGPGNHSSARVLLRLLLASSLDKSSPAAARLIEAVILRLRIL